MMCRLFVTVWKWFALAVPALAGPGIQSATALEGVAEINQYATAVVEEDRVLHQALPDASPEALKDISALYPIGTATAALFTQAHWILSGDGTTVLMLPLSSKAGLEALSPTGTWGQRDGALRLHMAGAGPRGLAVTLDGLLEPNGSDFRLDGIYTVMVRGARHAERLVLRLTPTTVPLPADQVNVALDRARQRRVQEAPSQDLDRLLSEPAEQVGGVPVPTSFDVTLKGGVDGVAFGPLTGELLLRRAEGSSGPTVSLLLTTDGPVIPGWSVWVTNHDLPPASELEPQHESESEHPLPPLPELPASPQVPEPGVTVTAEGGRIRAVITPAPPFRNVSWSTRNPDHPEGTAPVLAETGVIELRVTGDQISGTIKAEGRVLTGGRPASAFSAEVAGQRKARDLLGAITGTVGPRRFGGRWQDPRLGELDLRQEGAAVSGTFVRGGTIEGTTTGQVLDFRWRVPPGSFGQGFLRAAGSGLLVGMAWSREARDAVEPVIATQVLPAVGSIRDPATDDEAGALKFLGYDLVAAGKYREAADVLRKVLTYYRNRAAAVTDDPGAQHGYLAEQVVPIPNLIHSAFEAGDYPVLLDGLAMALELQRQLARDTTSLRVFRREAQRYVQSLQGTAETMGLLAEAFERGLGIVTGAGIGIGLEAAPDTGGLRITGVAPDMPAARAGIEEGDLIMSIDGVATANMDLKEATARLRESAGTTVAIVLLRDGGRRELELMRVPLAHVEPTRREALASSMTGLRDLAATSQQAMTAEAETVAAQASGSLELSADFDDLAARIARRQATLADARDRTAALAQHALNAKPEALDLFQRFIGLLPSMEVERLDPETAARLMALDQEIEELKRSRPANDIDKDLLELSGNMVGAFSTLRLELTGQRQLVEQTRETVAQAPTPDETQQRLASLTGWIDGWRARLVTDAGKIEALQLSQDVYARYVRILVDLNLPEQALVASEAARARAFLDLLAARSVTGPSDSSSALPASTTDLISVATASPLSLADIQEAIKASDATTIEYFLLDDQVLIWLISPSGAVQMRSVPVARAKLAQDVDQFVALIERQFDGESREERAKAKIELSALLEDIYDLLITPIKELLPQSPEDVVTVIPHGPLFRIPFAALKMKGKNRFMIEDHTVVYAPSIGILRHIQHMKLEVSRHRPLTLLGVVNPTFGKNVVDSAGEPFTPLPITEQKFDKIARYYTDVGSNRLTGTKATKKDFLAEAYNYDVIYFATHAEAIETDPKMSYIALADDRLRVPDVLKAKLQADLVILGACKTGRGRITGDGVEGLSRMFILAGTPTLFATLWEVPEFQTLDQSFLFHERWLGQGKSKAAALRDAQLQGLWNFPEQIEAWAGFVLVGAWR
jgi:CHAT domain-containing protein